MLKYSLYTIKSNTALKKLYIQLIKVVSGKIDDNEQNLWHNTLRWNTHPARFQTTNPKPD